MEPFSGVTACTVSTLNPLFMAPCRDKILMHKLGQRQVGPLNLDQQKMIVLKVAHQQVIINIAVF